MRCGAGGRLLLRDSKKAPGQTGGFTNADENRREGAYSRPTAIASRHHQLLRETETFEIILVAPFCVSEVNRQDAVLSTSMCTIAQ